MTLQTSLPCSAVNVPDDFFYMAGFEVTLYGRIWVSAEDHEAIIDFLTRSASLPFGIFPNLPASSEGWLDGGLADNVPIQPLIDYGCDTIIVISLDGERRDKSWVVETLKRLRFLRVLERESTRYFDLFVKRYGKELRLKPGSPNTWYYPSEGFLVSLVPALMGIEAAACSPLRDDFPEVWLERSKPIATTMPRLIFISPSRNLGGLLRGTLNFSAKKARELIVSGYQDTMEQLKRSEDVAQPAGYPNLG